MMKTSEVKLFPEMLTVQGDAVYSNRNYGITLILPCWQNGTKPIKIQIIKEDKEDEVRD